MHEHSIQYTLSIFEQLLRDYPPCAPSDVEESMRRALEQMEHNYNLTLVELEQTMIVFGKSIWPWRQAFLEMRRLEEGRRGEALFLQTLSAGMKKKYREFLSLGGTFRDLHGGGPFGFFSVEERQELCGALITFRKTLDQFVRQKIATTQKREYLDRVADFSDMLSRIERELDTLRRMADGEQEHPELAAEIREETRAFEYSFCALGQTVSFDAICRAPEHFVGRKKDKQMLRVL